MIRVWIAAKEGAVMLIHLSGVLSGKIGTEHRSVPLEKSQYQMADGTVYKLETADPVDITVCYKENRKVSIEAAFTLKGKAPCSRCLEEVEVSLPIQIARDIDFGDTEKERWEKLDEMEFLHEFDLDTEKLIQEEIIMAFPMQVLCREDCKGLCPQCGINRNKALCNCDDAPKDPRMAVISELFKQSIQNDIE